MATTGEVVWAAELRSLGRGPSLRVSTKRATQVSVLFQVGRWSNAASKEAQVGTLKVAQTTLYATRRVTPKVWLILRCEAWDRGGYTYRVRIKDWQVHLFRIKTGWEYVFVARDLTLIPQAFLDKARNALRRGWKDSDRVVKKPFGSYGRTPTTKPNPLVVYKPIGRWSEVYNANNPGSSYSYRDDTPISLQRYYHGWTSVNTPGFGRLRSRELPVNNWSSTIVITDNNPGGYLADAIVKSGWSSYEWYNHAWTYSSALATLDLPAMPPHSSVAYNKALSRLVEKCGLAIEANLAQDLAQFGQTTRLFTNTCYRLSGAVRSLRRGKFAAAVDYLWYGQNLRARNRDLKRLSNTKTLAQNWLEVQYGWKPALKDVEGSIRALKKFFEVDRIIEVGRSSARERTTLPMNPIMKHNVVVGQGEKYFTSTTRFGVRYKVDSAAKSFAAQLGFTNPVNLFWEMLPWSFVLDWALPIGMYLELLSAFDGLTFVDGFCTQFSKQRLTADIYYNGPVQYLGGNLRMYGSYSRVTVQVNRTKLTAFPSPKVPRLKNPISRVHVANALALLMTAFRSDPRGMRLSQKQSFHF